MYVSLHTRRELGENHSRWCTGLQDGWKEISETAVMVQNPEALGRHPRRQATWLVEELSVVRFGRCVTGSENSYSKP